MAKIKVDDTRANLIIGLSKETRFSEQEISDFLIDMGIAVLFSSRNSTDKVSLEKTVRTLSEKIQAEPKLILLCDLLERCYHAG